MLPQVLVQIQMTRLLQKALDLLNTLRALTKELDKLYHSNDPNVPLHDHIYFKDYQNVEIALNADNKFLQDNPQILKGKTGEIFTQMNSAMSELESLKGTYHPVVIDSTTRMILGRA